MLYILGIGISFFLASLLIFKKGKTKADSILAAWLLFIAVHQFLFYLDFSGIDYKYPFLLGAVMPFPLVHGPLLYLYVSVLVNRSPKRILIYLLHFLPFILVNFYLIRFYTLPASQKIFILENQGVGFETFVLLKFIAIIILGLGYVIWTLILVRRHQKTILTKFSDVEKINLKWLQYLTYGLGLIWIVVIFGEEPYIFTAVVIYTILIGFFGIKQIGIFTDSYESQSVVMVNESSMNVAPVIEPKQYDSENTQSPKPYLKSGLTIEKKKEIKKELELLMIKQKVYLISDLSLDMLAAKVNTHPNYLSQYINESLGLTFYDYVNTYRVDEFKRSILLPENNHLSMLAIAYDCGFNSKSSFNRNFRKIHGSTPSDYLKEIKNKSEKSL